MENKSFECEKFCEMKAKIIRKASEMFLKLGFKSITMDDIANEMCISKKTIYKHFANKKNLIQQSSAMLHEEIHQGIDLIIAKNYNAIEENFEILKLFKEIFKTTDTSPLYQLKKHYPEIHQEIVEKEIEVSSQCLQNNLLKGITEKLYRKEISIEACIRFYYTIIMNIHENTPCEQKSQELEILALEYHTRAIATPLGISELEKQLHKNQ